MKPKGADAIDSILYSFEGLFVGGLAKVGKKLKRHFCHCMVASGGAQMAGHLAYHG